MKITKSRLRHIIKEEIEKARISEEEETIQEKLNDIYDSEYGFEDEETESCEEKE
jgi:hypothetical protein